LNTSGPAPRGQREHRRQNGYREPAEPEGRPQAEDGRDGSAGQRAGRDGRRGQGAARAADPAQQPGRDQAQSIQAEREGRRHREHHPAQRRAGQVEACLPDDRERAVGLPEGGIGDHLGEQRPGRVVVGGLARAEQEDRPVQRGQGPVAGQERPAQAREQDRPAGVSPGRDRGGAAPVDVFKGPGSRQR
jgi:hypothetical protein